MKVLGNGRVGQDALPARPHKQVSPWGPWIGARKASTHSALVVIDVAVVKVDDAIPDVDTTTLAEEKSTWDDPWGPKMAGTHRGLVVIDVAVVKVDSAIINVDATTHALQQKKALEANKVL